MKKHPSKIKGFTLVELIVVITILVILGTIAFVSLGGFSGNARDGSRVSDLANISKGLDVYQIKNGSYPSPDSAFLVTYSGGVLWYQGSMGDGVVNMLWSLGTKLSRKPIDPLLSREYTYSVAAYTKEYQLKADYEGDSVSYRSYIPGMEEVYATSGNPTFSYLKGNYNGIASKTQSGSMTYVVAVPSIITSLSGSTGSGFDVIGALSNKHLIHGSTNSSGILYTAKLIYASGSLPSNNAERILFASGVATAYSGTSLASVSNIAQYISALSSNNTGTLASLGGGLSSTSLGGSAWVVVSGNGGGGGGTPNSCATPTPTGGNYGTPTTGTPTSVNQAWTYSATATGNCTYTCINGYSGNNCATAPILSYSSATTYTTGMQFTYNSATVTVTAAWRGTSNTTYLNCPSSDIVIWANGASAPQIWSLCNVGANTVFTGNQSSANDSPVPTEVTAGKYFQWGENVAWDYNGGTVSTDNCTWNRDTQSCGASALWSWSSSVSDTTSGGTARWYDWSTIDTRGPCAIGYHVPTQPEWNTAYTTLLSNRNTFSSTLKIPMAGARYHLDSLLDSQGLIGYYWSSSPSTTDGYYLSFEASSVSPARIDFRAFGFSVRCLKN